jgi:hypothetical protein
MKIILGLAAIFVGVCLCLRIDAWFWLGLGLLIWGMLQLPSEDECQDQVRPIGYRSGPRDLDGSAHRSGTTHGLGECSGFDCRL